MSIVKHCGSFHVGFKVAIDSSTAWILSIALDWLWEHWTRWLWLVWIVYFFLLVNSHQSCFDRRRARFSLSRVLLIAKPLEVAYIRFFTKDRLFKQLWFKTQIRRLINIFLVNQELFVLFVFFLNIFNIFRTFQVLRWYPSK